MGKTEVDWVHLGRLSSTFWLDLEAVYSERKNEWK